MDGRGTVAGTVLGRVCPTGSPSPVIIMTSQTLTTMR
jgi:hypothetical protein